MRHAHAIQVLRPLFKGRPITNPQRKMIQAHDALVEPVACSTPVDQQGKMHIARVVQVPGPEPRFLGFRDQPETQDPCPPSRAFPAIGDREVDVPEALDSWDGHGPFLSWRSFERQDWP